MVCPAKTSCKNYPTLSSSSLGAGVPKGLRIRRGAPSRLFSRPRPVGVVLFFCGMMSQVEGDFSQYMGQLQDKKHALTGEVLKYLGLQWVAPSATPR